MSMRCFHCGWDNTPEASVCEKCGIPMSEHPNKNKGTTVTGFYTPNKSDKRTAICPNGHIYDPSIYRGVCPFCPTTFSTSVYTNSRTRIESDMSLYSPYSPKPVVGFLYSIARKGNAEYWPLHLGRNTIGQSKDNDVVLQESSISAFHAVIRIIQTNRLKAFILDTGSSNGTLVNGEPLKFNRNECKMVIL